MDYYGPDDLEEFREWWLFHKPIKPPENSLFFVDKIQGIILFRQDHWQVEQIFVQPNASVGMHLHPNVEAYQVFISGDMESFCNFKLVDTSAHHYMACMHLPPTLWHRGNTGKRGACYFSIQKWLNGVKPHFLADDWADRKEATSLKEHYSKET